MRILIVGGGGAMAGGTIRDLLSPLSPGIEKIIAADTTAERLADLSRRIDDPRLTTARLDVTDAKALAGLLVDCDLCVNAVPTMAGHQMAIFHACLEGRRTYVDYGGLGVFTVKQKKEHEAWRKAGVTAILGLGSDPGISNILCKAVAERLDRIDRIDLYWAACLVGPENPVLVPPYNIATVLAEYAHPSTQFIDGALKEMPPQSGRETFMLPEPWGRTEFMHTAHSEPLTVPFADGIRDKGIREFTWRLHLPKRENEAWIGLVKAGFGELDDPIEVAGVAIKPIDFLDAVVRRNIARNAKTIPAQASHELHLAIGRGTRDGKTVTVNCAVIGGPHPDHEGYQDPGTSMGLSIGVQQILRNPLKPGVWGPEEYFDVAPFMTELEKRHFKVVRDLAVARV